MKIIEKFTDKKVAFIAALIPLLLMVLWQINNVGLPVADANDFLYSASSLSHYLYDGNIDRFLYALYAEKPWRPVSFHLFLFPFMFISGNNVLFTFSVIHSLALFFIIFYSYYIFRLVCISKLTCLLAAIVIGTLSNSFFPGGTHLFAETILTPALLASIFYLVKSNYMTDKKNSIYALIAMTICFTIRPIEAIIYLLPIIIFFLYFGFRERIFKGATIIKILQFIFTLFFLLALVKGFDISLIAKDQIKLLHDGRAEILYTSIFKYFSSIVIIFLFPLILILSRDVFLWIKNSKENNNESYVVIIFTSLSFLIFIWFLESWRDLYIWIYQTNFGQVAKANELVNHFFSVPLSFSDIYNRFFEQLKFSGLVPFILIFFITIISVLYKLYSKIKFSNKIYYYVFASSVIACIPVLITISNTSRKFALTYILFILFGILIFISIKKFYKIANYVFLSLAFIQILSISIIIGDSNFMVFDNGNKKISIFKKLDGTVNGYNIISGGNILNPVDYSFEPKVANLIHESSKNLEYKHSPIELPFMYHSLGKQGKVDIFTTNLLSNIKSYKKQYYTTLPIVLEGYKEKMLIKRISQSDGMFLINPYGNMDINKENLLVFETEIKESKYPQDLFYSNLMSIYFKGKLINDYNFKKYKCIDLSYKNNTREGCLFVKNTIKQRR